MRGGGTALVAVVAAVIGGVAGGGAVALLSDDDGGSGSGDAKTVVQQAPVGAGAGGDASGGEGLTASDIYKRDAPGVVFITAEVVQQTSSPFDLFPEEQRGQSTGTGFVIDADGQILTNNHVVENATKLTVRFQSGRTVSAKLVGNDPSTDLALLKVDPKGLNLRVLQLGTSREVEVGDPTVAIGNPYGLDLTLTTGVVSAKARQISAPNGFTIDDVLQTDAAINPGNSGGPLIDAAGRVIGINSQIKTGEQGGGNVGIGFAVPIDTAKRLLPELRKGGEVERSYIGIKSGTVTPDLNLRVDRGAYVTEVTPGGPAARAGLQPNDIITKIDGKDVRTNEDIGAVVDAKKPGATVKLEVQRAGDRATVEVKLAQRPAQTVGS